jgi:hypothetical protein
MENAAGMRIEGWNWRTIPNFVGIWDVIVVFVLIENTA